VQGGAPMALPPAGGGAGLHAQLEVRAVRGRDQHAVHADVARDQLLQMGCMINSRSALAKGAGRRLRGALVNSIR
jgi:hypothetical protein